MQTIILTTKRERLILINAAEKKGYRLEGNCILKLAKETLLFCDNLTFIKKIPNEIIFN